MEKSVKQFDEELTDLLHHAGAGATYPPNCLVAMKAEVVHYESRTSLTVKFPVLEESLNPLRTMQGGFIVAAFDNVFGPLSYAMNLSAQFIRPILPGDWLTITAKIVSRGNQILYMTAEAFNEKGKLIATGSANAMMLKSEPKTSS
jgi:acyl-coenzyme A thioesterase PaaI-like protein